MCFGASVPKPTPPPAPATARDATLEGKRSAAAAAARGGIDDTKKSGLGGVEDTGGTRTILGA